MFCSFLSISLPPFFSSQCLSNSMDLFIDTFQDKVGAWFSNPGTGTAEPGAVGGGGVGKYLKSRTGQAEPAPADTGLQAMTVAKKRKLGIPTAEFKDFSAW